MSVVHQAGKNDQLSCDTCRFSFELDLSGEHLYVTHWPASIAALAGSAGLLWLTVGELKSFVRQIDQAENGIAVGDSKAQAALTEEPPVVEEDDGARQ